MSEKPAESCADSNVPFEMPLPTIVVPQGSGVLTLLIKGEDRNEREHVVSCEMTADKAELLGHLLINSAQSAKQSAPAGLVLDADVLKVDLSDIEPLQ